MSLRHDLYVLSEMQIKSLFSYSSYLYFSIPPLAITVFIRTGLKFLKQKTLWFCFLPPCNHKNEHFKASVGVFFFIHNCFGICLQSLDHVCFVSKTLQQSAEDKKKDKNFRQIPAEKVWASSCCSRTFPCAAQFWGATRPQQTEVRAATSQGRSQSILFEGARRGQKYLGRVVNENSKVDDHYRYKYMFPTVLFL